MTIAAGARFHEESVAVKGDETATRIRSFSSHGVWFDAIRGNKEVAANDA